jgi:NAD(P)-dependent dehydrogenase (short-subunit alcohol dehydrogenase family)
MMLNIARLFDLTGKVAFVTGAAQGIGESIARTLAAAGATVVLTDIKGGQVEANAQDIVNDGGTAISMTVNMAVESSIVDAIDATHQRFGRFDILVNNAGIFDRAFLEDSTSEYWARIMDINLRGPFISTREAVRVMRANQTDGRIVNIGSDSAFHATIPSLLAYSTSKAGVVALTRATAMEVAKDRIRANAVCPGNTATPGQSTASGPAFSPKMLAKFAPPLGRAGTPQDIANAVLFAASDASSNMTGQTIVVDGGALTC